MEISEVIFRSENIGRLIPNSKVQLSWKLQVGSNLHDFMMTFSHLSQVCRLWIDGKKVFDLTRLQVSIWLIELHGIYFSFESRNSCAAPFALLANGRPVITQNDPEEPNSKLLGAKSNPYALLTASDTPNMTINRGLQPRSQAQSQSSTCLCAPFLGSVSTGRQRQVETRAHRRADSAMPRSLQLQEKGSKMNPNPSELLDVTRELILPPPKAVSTNYLNYELTSERLSSGDPLYSRQGSRPFNILEIPEPLTINSDIHRNGLISNRLLFTPGARYPQESAPYSRARSLNPIKETDSQASDQSNLSALTDQFDRFGSKVFSFHPIAELKSRMSVLESVYGRRA